MAKQPEQPAPVEAPDEMAELLKQAAAQMQAAAESKGDRAVALREVETLLAKIKIADFPDLADSPIVQAFIQAMGFDDLKPGQTKNRGTLAERAHEWTRRELEDEHNFKKVTFTPNETTPVTWNGLTYQLVADEEITVPEPIANIYREHREALKQAALHERWLMGQSSIAPHPNWQADEGAVVRAWSTRQGPQGQTSGRMGVGLIYNTGEGAGE